MDVLVDTSIWIEYFRGSQRANALNWLIDENLVITNALILTELVPSLQIKRQTKLIGLLHEINTAPLHIQWQELMTLQTRCLRQGINGIGIADLIIAQNAQQHDCMIYSLDKHVTLLSQLMEIRLYQP